MRYFKIVSHFLFYFFITQQCYAQDTEYVYKDSSIIKMDAADAVAPINKPKKELLFHQDEALDSTLNQQKNNKSNDSAEALKSNTSFAYAKNLDSLLKQAQKHQESRSLIVPGERSSWLERFFTSEFTKIFFWILAAIFVGFILYKLLLTEGIFQKKITNSRVQIVNDTDDDLSPLTNYQSLIARSVNNKNYRLAIRYHFLQTLQKLAAKGAIQYAADKTNYQYSTELYGNPNRDNFLALTINYEYAWYGDFNITDTMFERIQNNFLAFNNNL